MTSFLTLLFLGGEKMGGLIFLYVTVAVILLTIQYIVAKKFEEIAFQKGYDESIHSCAMCFWLGIVGYIYVVALPNLNNSLNGDSVILKSNNETNSAKKVEKVQQYECPKCREILPFGIDKCPVCGQVFDWNK